MPNQSALIDTILKRRKAAPALTPSREYDRRGQRLAVGAVTVKAQRTESPKRRLRRIGRERACVDQIERLPAMGEELLMILDGRWHGWDLVGAVLNLKDQPVSHLHVATLGFNRAQTHHLVELLDDQHVHQVTMLVSELFREKDRDDYNLLSFELARRHQAVAACRNHAKLLLFDFDDGTVLTAHGSLNLRRCNAFEQLAMTPDPEVHAFFRQYIEEQAQIADQTQDQGAKAEGQ